MECTSYPYLSTIVDLFTVEDMKAVVENYVETDVETRLKITQSLHGPLKYDPRRLATQAVDVGKEWVESLKKCEMFRAYDKKGQERLMYQFTGTVCQCAVDAIMSIIGSEGTAPSGLLSVYTTRALWVISLIRMRKNQLPSLVTYFCEALLCVVNFSPDLMRTFRDNCVAIMDYNDRFGSNKYWEKRFPTAFPPSEGALVTMENDSDHPLSDGDEISPELPATTSGDSDEDVANGCGVNQSHPAATAASRTTLTDVSEEGHPPVSRPACTVPTEGNEGGNGLINNCDEEDEEEAEGEGNSLIPNSKSKTKSKSNSRSEVTTLDNRPTKLRKYTNTEDMSRGDFLEVFINSQSLEDDQDECLKFLRTLGSRGAASTKDLGSFVGMEPDLLTRSQWIELFEHTKKEGKTIKSQIRHPSSTDVKKLLPLRPAGTLTCGKPDILKTVYEGAQGIEEKVKAVIALLGGKGDGAYRALANTGKRGFLLLFSF